jgi:hypothetical protein
MTAPTATTFSHGADSVRLGLPKAVRTAWYRPSTGLRCRATAKMIMVAINRPPKDSAASGSRVERVGALPGDPFATRPLGRSRSSRPRHRRRGRGLGNGPFSWAIRSTWCSRPPTRDPVAALQDVVVARRGPPGSSGTSVTQQGAVVVLLDPRCGQLGQGRPVPQAQSGDGTSTSPKRMVSMTSAPGAAATKLGAAREDTL